MVSGRCMADYEYEFRMVRIELMIFESTLNDENAILRLKRRLKEEYERDLKL